MLQIQPVSELRNYNKVLDKVKRIVPYSLLKMDTVNLHLLILKNMMNLRLPLN